MPDFDIVPADIVPPIPPKRPGPPPEKLAREVGILKPCADASSIAGGDISAITAMNAAGTTKEGREAARMADVKAARMAMALTPEVAGPAAATRQRRQLLLTPSTKRFSSLAR